MKTCIAMSYPQRCLGSRFLQEISVRSYPDFSWTPDNYLRHLKLCQQLRYHRPKAGSCCQRTRKSTVPKVLRCHIHQQRVYQTTEARIGNMMSPAASGSSNGRPPMTRHFGIAIRRTNLQAQCATIPYMFNLRGGKKRSLAKQAPRSNHGS